MAVLTDSFKESAPSYELGDVVASFKGVSKKFCKSLKRSMAYGMLDLSKNLVGIRPQSTKLRRAEFWALDDVSFELRRGESLGLIGVNGSGKTTLLRMLTGIFPPDRGEIMVKGRMAALIAVGAGFHGHLTGRENVYLNGSILGMSRSEIDAEFDDIVSFADIGDFLDAPVSTYSSGMRIRLGFSVATAVRPDILLLDEILAVGDIAFQNKCFGRVNKLLRRGTAVVLVSHMLQRILQYTQRSIWLDEGKLKYDGETIEACRQYIISSQKDEEEVLLDTVILTPSTGFEFVPSTKLRDIRFRMLDGDGSEVRSVKIHDRMVFDFSYYFAGKTERLEMGAAVYRDDGLQMTAMNTLTDGMRFSVDHHVVRGRLDISHASLAPGKYRIVFDVKERQEYLFRGHPIEFLIQSDKVHFGVFTDLPHEWEIEHYSGTGVSPGVGS